MESPLRRIQALGIEHLHACGIIHHDIKPDNILVDRDGHCVITDFGGARFLHDGQPELTPEEPMTHTPSYTAPELLLEGTYDASVDYWSLGVTITELLLGEDVRICLIPSFKPTLMPFNSTGSFARRILRNCGGPC